MAEANVFEMTGDGVQISYSARGPFIDQPGLKPTFGILPGVGAQQIYEVLELDGMARSIPLL